MPQNCIYLMIYFEMMKASDLWILAGIILGGLIVTGYTGAQFIKSVNSEAEAEEAQKDRDSIEKEFRTQLAAKNEEISILQNQANDKLTEANSKLIETIKMTIGEGIPNVIINNFADNLYTVRIANTGKYPIYDVSLSMYDFDLIMKSCPSLIDKGMLIIDEDCLDLKTTYFTPFEQTVRSKGNARLNQTITLKEGYNNLVFNSHARHNSFLIRYVIKNDKQNISFAYKVYDVGAPGRPEVYTDGELKISEDYWEKKFPPLNLKYGRLLRRE